jgi:uncharacterized repeat protein (TIGR03803 family)
VACLAISSLAAADQYSIIYSLPTPTSQGTIRIPGLTGSGGKLYGETATGGTNNRGTVYSINVDGTGYQVLRSLTDGGLTTPTISGSKLYGAQYGPGGSVFSMNLDGTSFTTLKSFGSAGPNEPVAPIAVSGSSIYFTTFGFGPETKPTLYSNSATSSTINWTLAPSSGLNINGNTGVVVSGSKVYGANNSNQLYSVNTDGTGLQTLQSLPGQLFSELNIIGSTLYGSAGGVAFSVATNGSNLQTIHTFSGGLNGSGTVGTMIQSLTGTLIGTTTEGGQFGGGTLFEMNTNGSAFHLLHSFGGPGDASTPNGNIVQLGNSIYGVTQSGKIFAYVVPEPSTYALAAMGVVALLASRRRKA